MSTSVLRTARAFVAASLLALGAAVPITAASAAGTGTRSSHTLGAVRSADAVSVTAAAGAGWIARSMNANGGDHRLLFASAQRR